MFCILCHFSAQTYFLYLLCNLVFLDYTCDLAFFFVIFAQHHVEQLGPTYFAYNTMFSLRLRRVMVFCFERNSIAWSSMACMVTPECW